MIGPLDHQELWRSTLASQEDLLDIPRETLRQAFLSFRARVAQLVADIGSELPGLTVHDISHLDALWRVAHQIAGEDYPLNPAEAFVLGGAFLLHDAAHVLAAYPGGLADIRQSVQWKDLVAQKYGGVDPAPNSAQHSAAVFQVLRHLHANQAKELPAIKWTAPDCDDPVYLIENALVRNFYGSVIGEIAASHHWSPETVAATFAHRKVACPAFLSPASWEVDALKVALLLRTADAAHLDDSRAPWFLFALRKPQGISATHWHFQAKLGQPARTPNGELLFSSGAPFQVDQRDSWWLAWDTARMVDAELRSAHEILREEGRPLFAASSVVGAESPQGFAKHVPTAGWVPIDAAPKIGDPIQVITRLGGAALYGDNNAAPLRELLQNGLDAVRALRALGGLESEEGEVKVSVSASGEGNWWLSVTDTGLGMSKYVLTKVLLDFGTSLWGADALREELPGLAQTNFNPVGKFGIGFFSVFMIGDEVRVTTRRYAPSANADGVDWELRFENGLVSRPALIRPSSEDQLKRTGTRVAVKISTETLNSLITASTGKTGLAPSSRRPADKESPSEEEQAKRLNWLVTRLCPSSSVKLTTKFGSHPAMQSVAPNDWMTVEASVILARSNCRETPLAPLIDGKGNLVGRVGVTGSYYSSGYASLTYQGVLCGQASGLVGLVQAINNNLDARRESAMPCGELQAWSDWAKRILERSEDLKPRQLLRLHPLVPELDLPVWEWGDEHLTLEDLAKRIEGLDELILHEGSISHDDTDDVSSNRFSDSFVASPSLVCIPDLTPNSDFDFFFDSKPRSKVFPWGIGAKPIDYRARLIAAIAGENFDPEEDSHIVGEVDGVEIYRIAERLVRSE